MPIYIGERGVPIYIGGMGCLRIGGIGVPTYRRNKGAYV